MAKKRTSDALMNEALEQFDESQEGSDFNRKDAEDDITFARLGEQWPEKVKKSRQDEGRPCLTINKLPAFIRQVVNDARQNKPSGQVHPVDNGADKATAEVIAGMVRNIERASDADVAYDTGIEHAVSGGFGFWRIGIDYAHEDSFEMEARIDRVPNPLMVHWDVNSTKFDASDWRYCFVSDFLTEDQFEEKYPKADKVSFQGTDARDDVTSWLDDDKVRVAEYWRREEKKRKILLLSNNRVIRADLFDEMQQAMAAVQGITVLKEREACYYEVTRRVMSGVEILEEEPWPGSMIPIVPVWGEEVITGGRRYFRSLVRDARDPQTMFNFWRTASTELVALAPRAPWIGPKGFAAGNEANWAQANTRSFSYLEYDKAAGEPPQRQPFAGVPAGALQEALNASDDMKAVMSIYDSSLGQRSNEQSGKAILARQRESDTANFHFIDNLNRAVRYSTKCLVEIIPHVYSGRETIRILGDDMTEKVVSLMKENPGQMPMVEGENGPMYDLTVGKYDVTIKSGPSYSTMREETRETLIEIMRAVPQSAMVLGDVLMEYMDFPGADKVAERLKLMLPPQVQMAEGMTPPMPMGMPPGPMAGPGLQNPGAPQAQPAMPAPPMGGL